MKKYYSSFARSYRGDNPSKFRALINKLSFHCANMSDGKTTISLSAHTPDGDVTVLRTPFVEYVKVTLTGGGSAMFFLNDGDYNILYTFGVKPAEGGKKGIITKIYDIGTPDESKTSKIYPPYVYSVNTHDPFEKITVRSLKTDTVLASLEINGKGPAGTNLMDFCPTPDGVITIWEKQNVLMSWYRSKFDDVWGPWTQYLPEDLVPGYVETVDVYFVFFSFDRENKQFVEGTTVKLPITELASQAPQNEGYAMNGLFDFVVYGKDRFLIALEGRGDFSIYNFPDDISPTSQLWPAHVGAMQGGYPGIAYMYDSKTLEYIPLLSRHECTDLDTNNGILREIVNDSGGFADELWNIVGESITDPHMDVVKYNLSSGEKTIVFTVGSDWITEYSAMQGTYEEPRFILDGSGILIAHKTSGVWDGFHRVDFNGNRDPTGDIISLQNPSSSLLWGGRFKFAKNIQVKDNFYSK